MAAGGRGRSRRPMWWLIGALGLVVVAVSAYLAWSLLGTYRLGEQAQADISLVRDAVAASDWEAALVQVPVAAESASSLATATEGLPWRVLELVPGVSATATATRQLSVSMAEVLGAAEPLVPYADRLLTGDVRDDSGAFDLNTFSEVATLLEQLSTELVDSEERLATIDVTAVREPVASGVADFVSVAEQYSSGVNELASVAGRVPGLLGADGARTWLVLLQNPAEARGSGGFIGGFAIVNADSGRVTVESAGTSQDLETTRIPVDDVPEEDRIMWGPYLTSWKDFNLSPDFPLAARQTVAGMKARGVDVSGVLALDPAVVAAVMRATGPVTVGDLTVTADNVEQFFLVDVYREYPDAVERDLVSLAIVTSVLESVLGANPDVRTLVDELPPVVEAGRVKAWSADAAEQEWLASTVAGGVLPDDPGPVVAVSFNNSAANKMDAFVATSVDYRPGTCPAVQRQESSLRVTLRNDAPADLSNASGYYGRGDKPGAPEGSTSMLVHLYLPVDSLDEAATIDGEPADMYPEVKGGRLAWWVVVDIERGQERVIEMTFTEPTVPSVEPRVITQPMAVPTAVTVEPASSC